MAVWPSAWSSGAPLVRIGGRIAWSTTPAAAIPRFHGGGGEAAIASLKSVLFPAMAVLNRCALAVAPNSPMREWSRPFWSREDQAGGPADESLYLIPAYDDDGSALALLRELHGEIFAAELDLWCVDRQLWPSPRNFDLFLQWFSLRFFPLVEDLGVEPLVAYRVGEGFRGSVADALDWNPPQQG
jgi:hypothetical protein